MTLALFPSNYHLVRHVYPAGDQQQFGNGYQYAVKPLLPLQRTFILKFPTLVWGSSDTSQDMQTLVNFYELHELWDRFNYNHPQYGMLIVRFAKSLEIPESIPGGSGATQPFEIHLIEQPL